MDDCIKISDLYVTQRSLKRAGQIPDMIAYLSTGGAFTECPPIELKSPSDGVFIINNGHHRVTAIYLSGRDFLYPDEYCITYESDYNRSVYRKLIDMWYAQRN